MREDAEISTTIANLRTLISEASAYYVAHGTFGSSADGPRWNEVTNVPLNGNTTRVVAATDSTDPTAHLQAGGQNCIGVRLVNKNGATPAYIAFTRTSPGANTVCGQVLASQAVTDYIDSAIGEAPNRITNAIPVGSSRGIYRPAGE